jgi:hypothetical protein
LKIQQWGPGTGRLVPVAFAFRDQEGGCHGQPERLSTYTEATLSIPFDANAKAFAGQTITLQVGLLTGKPNPIEGDISTSSTLVTGTCGPRRVLFTHQVADLLAGTRSG